MNANQWIEVDASSLAHNIREFRRHAGPDVLIAPVVKSNGYGHGLERAARAFIAGGADWLCVHSWREAQRVEALGLGKTTLVLGPLTAEDSAEAVRAGVHVCISSLAALQFVTVAAMPNKPALVHVKVETGTHRQGLEGEALQRVLAGIAAAPHVELVGAHSHFANIEDTTRHEFANAQRERFQAALEQMRELGIAPRIRHLASSAAAILFEDVHLDLIRPGIAAYGFWPSRETLVSARESGHADYDLQPALTWKSRLSEVKQVRAGGFIGYGCTEKVEADTCVGVVPVGYGDGYRRQMGGRAHVLIRGSRCKVLGRICMNLMMVDLSHLADPDVGEEIVLLGRQEGEEISAEQLADWAQTIHYEVLAGLSPEIDRVGA